MEEWRRSVEVEIDTEIDNNCREDTRTTVVVEEVKDKDSRM